MAKREDKFEYNYAWRKGARFSSLDPEKVGQIIEKCGDLDDPNTPRILVKEAKSKNHYLHSVLYEKTDQQAALEYRLQLCRTMISSLEVVKVRVYMKEIEGGRTPKRITVHETVDSGRGESLRGFVSDYNGKYKSTKTKEGREALIRQVRIKLINIREEYAALEPEFKGVFAAIDKMKAEFETEYEIA